MSSGEGLWRWERQAEILGGDGMGKKSSNDEDVASPPA